MADHELFTKALSLEKPWYVKDVKFDPSGRRLDIYRKDFRIASISGMQKTMCGL